MRVRVLMCDECEDENDPTTRRASVRYSNGHVENLDLCDFCCSQIEGAPDRRTGGSKVWSEARRAAHDRTRIAA